MPSAHTYTGSRSSSRRCFHVSYSACQPAFSRAIDGADSGAAAPSSPRRARSKSPWANPCRYSSGRSRPTSSVRRLNSGSRRLSNRASSPRTRGRRIVIVPVIALSRRGLPYPFRYPARPSTPSRRSYRRRPKTSSTSSSKSCCSSRCTPCRASASRLSHTGLDSVPVSVLCSFMGGVSFPGVLSAGGSLVANRRLHRLLFVYTPVDVTSHPHRQPHTDDSGRDRNHALHRLHPPLEHSGEKSETQAYWPTG